MPSFAAFPPIRNVSQRHGEQFDVGLLLFTRPFSFILGMARWQHKRKDRMEDEQLIERAIKAHHRWCNLNGAIPDQPGRLSDVEDIGGVPHVVLRNVRGVMAVYAYNGKRLRRLSDEEIRTAIPEEAAQW